MKMKALQIVAPRQARLIEVPIPEPPADEVVLRVRAVTTCPQWDLHLYRGEPMFVGCPISYPYTPGQPGHEAAGDVAAVGSNVRTFKEGDRVVAWRDPGHRRPGCYAEYVAFDPANLLPLPAGGHYDAYASFELAMCVGATFLDIARHAKLNGLRVGVSGLGGGGLIAAQLAKAEGAAEVIGFEVNPRREALARTLGVDRVINPREIDADAFRAAHGPIDIAVDCVGSKAAAEYLMRVTSRIVALFGVQREGYTYPCQAGRLKLFGYPGHSLDAAAYAMEHVASGRVRLAPLAGLRMALEDYDEAVARLERQEALKVLFGD